MMEAFFNSEYRKCIHEIHVNTKGEPCEIGSDIISITLLMDSNSNTDREKFGFSMDFPRTFICFRIDIREFEEEMEAQLNKLLEIFKKTLHPHVLRIYEPVYRKDDVCFFLSSHLFTVLHLLIMLFQLIEHNETVTRSGVQNEQQILMRMIPHNKHCIIW